jgi:hypothetical protein
MPFSRVMIIDNMDNKAELAIHVADTHACAHSGPIWPTLPCFAKHNTHVDGPRIGSKAPDEMRPS